MQLEQIQKYLWYSHCVKNKEFSYNIKYYGTFYKFNIMLLLTQLVNKTRK